MFRIRFLFLLLFISCTTSGISQIVGTVSDPNGDPLPYVNIYVDNYAIGTTTNEDGKYQLSGIISKEYTVVFQFLGFKTLRKKITVTKLPYRLNVQLQLETTSLETVVLTSKENPAYRVIRGAIKKRKENLAKIQKFTADFYSRGLWRIKNAPKNILGQEIGDFNGGLDSTRSGVIYLSETISEIAYRAPNDFNEKIIASKVSGDDNGFSLNSARESNISFYQNTIRLNTSEVVSPIADYGFNYYDYELEGVFYDDLGNLINKIKVIPKRPKDRVFSGYIYIIEELWELYGIDLTTTGEAIQVPPIEKLIFKQNFKYSTKDQLWIRISQTLDFSFALFGISGNGRFTAVYRNYDFSPDFSKQKFTKEILSFADLANAKDSVFWKSTRPVPLTDEESTDYVKKDSVQQVRGSKTYLDSIDHVRNRFKFFDPLLGYTFQNSYKKWKLELEAPLRGLHFNTIQGWNINLKTRFRKNQEKNEGKYWEFFNTTSYGFSDDRVRLSGGYRQKFNNYTRPILTLSGGIKTQQFNASEPISPLINDITTTFFERNFIKTYDRLYAEAAFAQELLNGFRFYSTLSFQKRSPLRNTIDQVIVPNKDVSYTSNNPLQPLAFESTPFIAHNIAKLELTARINFGQEYISFPDGKFNLGTDTYPTLYLGYEKGLGATLDTYNFDHIKGALMQSFNAGNKGRFGYSIRAGTFLNADDISFIDYKHFEGNQTRVGTTTSYLNKLNLLPYYTLSTNKDYAEAHVEHDFKGWVLGKLPLINKLNYNLILGAHAVYTADNKPYSEFSVGIDNLGFGKYRILRIDYVVANQDGNQEGAFIFGLKFLSLFE